MTWVRLDDQFPNHAKIMSVGSDAFRLHVTAMCWSATQLTDGAVPAVATRQLGWFCADLGRSITELETAGLWDVAPGGWMIHDYLDYNPSREQVTKERAEAKERMRNKRGSSPEVHPNISRTSDNVQGPPSPSPSPLPVTEPEAEKEKESESSVYGSGSSNGHATVDSSLFLTVIGFKDPEPFLKVADETCLAMWAYHYTTLTEPERKSVKSWPALINSKVRAGEQPRWKNGELKPAFYQTWTQ